LRIGIVTVRVGLNDGQGRVNLEIAAEALRQGHEVRLFCEAVDPGLKQAGATIELTPSPFFLPSRLIKDQIFAWRSRERLARDIRGFDAVLVNGFATWASSDVNAVHFVHSSWLRSPHHPWRQRRAAHSLYTRLYGMVNALLERSAFKRSGAVVAVSEKVRAELIELGVPQGRITTILNGVDPNEFRPGQSHRVRYGLPPDVQIALFAGDLKTSRKNLDSVLQSMTLVPDLHLAVAGRHEGTPWPDLARKLGVDARVHFLGLQKDMPSLMRSTDMLVFPSRYEACSLVLLEALSTGLPVITAESAGGAELISHDVGIVLKDSDDIAALAAALTELSKNVERRAAMSTAAREVAISHSWSQMAKQYLELLEKMGNLRKNRKAAEIPIGASSIPAPKSAT
jgi:glycosyltransferase involved in cell wall biosynthesis